MHLFLSFMMHSSLLAEVSFLLPSLGFRVREKIPLPKLTVSSMRGGNVATNASSDTSCCVGSLNDDGITVKDERGTRQAQITVSKHTMEHAV